jgi:hypothetical protein
MLVKYLIATAALVVATATSTGAAFARADTLKTARAGTAAFHDLDKAVASGYAQFVDANGIACIDNPGVGGMGVHFANLGVVLDPAIDAAAPEALVYEPKSDGSMRLVAAEYIVFQSAWDATHTSPPSLFGHEFELLASPNRYGLPPFYELHAWIWKHNPRGMFDDWNPLVSCSPGDATARTAATSRIRWTADQLQALADAYRAKNPGWRAPVSSDLHSAADMTWTGENLDRLASAYAALNPGWTRPAVRG